MAVTGSSLHWKGASGSYKKGEGPSYTAVYRVTTNSANDQSQTIINWVRDNIAELGAPYAYAGDTDETLAILRTIAADRELGSTNIWEVVLSYDSSGKDEEKPEEGEDEEGNPTEDPTEFRPQISVATVHRTKPVEKAKYLGGFTGWAHQAIMLGNRVIPCNSAMTPYNPGLEKEFSQLQISIQRNLDNFDGDEAQRVVDTVNATSFRINRWGFSVFVEKYHGKITSWKADLRLQWGQEVWDSVMTILVDRDGWVDEIVDRGIAASANDGDPDGRGGYISPGDAENDKWHLTGVPRIRRLQDPDGMPITEPVLFDGKGQPLDLNTLGPGTLAAQTVYSKWLKYDEREFKALRFLNGIVF